MPVRPDFGMDMRQGPLGPGLTSDANDDDAMDQNDDPMEGKEDKTSALDLGALERDLLEYQFSEDDDDGEVDGPLLLMMPSSILSPKKEAAARLSLVDAVGLAFDSRRGYAQKLPHESPRRRIDQTMRVPRHVARGRMGKIPK